MKCKQTVFNARRYTVKKVEVLFAIHVALIFILFKTEKEEGMRVALEEDD